MGEVRRAAPAQLAAKEGGGGGGGGGRGAGGGGGGGGGVAGEFEYSPLVLQGVEPEAAAEAAAGVVEAAVEVAVAGAAVQVAVAGAAVEVAAGVDGEDACRVCETWRDGSWAVRS